MNGSLSAHLAAQAEDAGHFGARQFQGRAGKGTTDELALNPDHFVNRSDEEILSTLVYEMVHVWQQAYGESGRQACHNQEWAARMKRLGLHPSDTGALGGKETDPRVSHYIIPAGPAGRG